MGLQLPILKFMAKNIILSSVKEALRYSEKQRSVTMKFCIGLWRVPWRGWPQRMQQAIHLNENLERFTSEGNTV